jgi:proteasome accessory factor A
VAERLIGIETEYALSAVDARGARVNHGQVLDALMRNARQRFRHLPDELARGMFLENGARFYIDCGGHPEFTTPECSNPWDAVRYIRAGEAMLLQLADRRTSIFRCNVDYVTGAAWGMHENYMHQADPRLLPKQMIPHLVSRIIYTGAGGFVNQSPGLEFTLSPRAAHLEVPTSHDSTTNRPIFHTKDEDLCDGRYHRLHLVCGESLCSDLATWLRMGTTALVLALCEAGVRPGEKVGLRNPVLAMRAFADDPTCRATAEASGGRRLSALAIQRHYLELAEAHVGHALMPTWAPEVCRRWRAVLDALESGWESMATTLDWAIKLALYRDRTRRRDLPWESLEPWTFVAKSLTAALQAKSPTSRLTAELALSPDGPIVHDAWALNDMLDDAGLDWSGLGPFLRTRDELREIDTRFGQLGPEGLFARLDAAGALTHRVEGIDDIDRAVATPPDVPRARVRGELVRTLAGSALRYACDWDGVWDDESGNWVDLSDPFAASSGWNREEDFALGERCPSGLGRRSWRSSLRLSARDPISLNQAALEHRQHDRLEEAERLLRQAIPMEDARVPADSPKRPHRRNNLAIVLMRAGKLEEALAFNAEAWALKAGRHDLTSGRILFVRVALVLLGDFGGPEHYLGQLKSLFAQGPLECHGDIAIRWDIPDVLNLLRRTLWDGDAELLGVISSTLNHRESLRYLEQLQRWRDVEPVGLDAPWPGL